MFVGVVWPEADFRQKNDFGNAIKQTSFSLFSHKNIKIDEVIKWPIKIKKTLRYTPNIMSYVDRFVTFLFRYLDMFVASKFEVHIILMTDLDVLSRFPHRI